MKADTKTLHDIFASDGRYTVPPYQRPYVWELGQQWEPLWEDVVATIERLAEARAHAHHKGDSIASADAKVSPHFLGAVVFELVPFGAGDIDRHSIVDGQQRLTTVQLLLRGVLDALQNTGLESIGKQVAQIRKLILNDEDVVSDHEGLFKLWPRRSDRTAFAQAMADDSPNPTTSRFAAARHFFTKQAASWLRSTESPVDPSVEDLVAGRAGLLVAALRSLMKIVVINLEAVDDSQVIFEVLNARNTPLTAADLVKNLLFMRAESESPHTVEALYDTYWKQFDEDTWWTEQVGVGHASRPRIDRFLADFLIAQTGRLVNVSHLYGDLRRWVVDSDKKVDDIFIDIHTYADAYTRLRLRDVNGLSSAEQRAFARMRPVNVVLADPLLLWLLTRPSDELAPQSRERAILAVESYLIRRMAAKWQTRAYGNVFTDVLRAARGASSNIDEAVITSLLKGPHSYFWPTDEDIEAAFSSSRAYGPGGMNQARLRMLLSAVDQHLHATATRTESVDIDYSTLTVEHVMPQSWRSHWPLPGDQDGAGAIGRDQAVQRIGNLTLITGSLNSEQSHGDWDKKREALKKHSVLRINAELTALDRWDESTIDARSLWLGQQVAAIWSRPETPPEEHGHEAPVDEVDDESIHLIRLELSQRAARQNDDVVTLDELTSVLQELGLATSPEAATLTTLILERLVGEGAVERVDQEHGEVWRVLDRHDV